MFGRIFAESGSLKLDVRTGTCETYDKSTNPLAKKESRDIKEIDVDNLVLEIATKKPEIKIVYDSKADEKYASASLRTNI